MKLVAHPKVGWLLLRKRGKWRKAAALCVIRAVNDNGWWVADVDRWSMNRGGFVPPVWARTLPVYGLALFLCVFGARVCGHELAQAWLLK